LKRRRGEAERGVKAKPHASRHAPAPAPLSSARYLFFGGKGGVGKTTTASAAALFLLDRARADERVLLFSTDPAHSLSDSLNVAVGDRLVEVAQHRRARLVAYEMDASVALEKFKTKHRAVLSEIAERGTLLDESDINELLDLSLPGMDEVMALFELSELDRTNEFARIVVDTAPSGHTSRLLRLPETFAHMVAALDRMSEKHRYIIAQFARRTRAPLDEVDLFLRDLDERIARVRTLLYDPAQTSFTLVTIPEAMAVEETVRYLALLRDEGVPVTDLIINRVEAEHDDCRYCHARVRSQHQWLKQIEKEFSALRRRRVPLLAGEVRDLDELRRFAGLVWPDESAQAQRADEKKTGGKRSAGKKSVASAASFSAPDADAGAHPNEANDAGFELEPRRLLIFGGKGGVGKTTTAAAAALAAAELDARARVLVFSTDPAHSLSDSFNEEIGELKQSVAGQKNLDAMEIDPGARFEELKARYRAWTDELFDTLMGSSRWEVQFDREAMRELVALAPPGIDEIAALAAISDLVDQDRYTSIVLDTAPTGHLVRFLELPDVALSWVRTFIKLLLKYKNVVHASGVAEELIALSKSIKRVIALLTDAEACEFIGVAIPERMSLAETDRLTATLERLKVPMRRLLVNMVVPTEAAGACGFCQARRQAQGEVLDEFARSFKRALYVAPQQPQEVRGRAGLRAHFAAWRRVGAQTKGAKKQRTGNR
jgi:arsenite/tail-anchored protein-transporting ATPase